MAWKWRSPIGALISAIKNKGNFLDFLAANVGLYREPEQAVAEVPQSTVNDAITDAFNDHNLSQEPDQNGYQQIEITPADPTSSAANVINYDPNKSSQENLLGYAQVNNSASAYSQYLANQYATEMSNSALSRAIADAEANGISKYQLFQSGNMAASTPSSGNSIYQSYENAMNRRESWNEKELNAIVKIITSTISSAMSLIK